MFIKKILEEEFWGGQRSTRSCFSPRAIVAAWKRTESETVALIAELPPEFVKQKINYLNTGNNLMIGLPGHSRTHFNQMREAIASARE
ncbi:hypothetical protein [Candidatus Scalindua japonica]|uniref:hypothetical protein n=1 Tax=Candidatus Scalindua japonica TaxID=1284222 RepID=UPI000BDE9929|nr:hypothetical protein [Candidatus Scalindua japonica]